MAGGTAKAMARGLALLSCLRLTSRSAAGGSCARLAEGWQCVELPVLSEWRGLHQQHAGAVRVGASHPQRLL